jgi:hypothetical protein
MSQNKAKKVTFYLSSTDKFRHEPLYEVIVYVAKRYGLSGATVVKGFMGYGSSSIVSNLRFWEFSDKVPIMIHIIDTEEKITAFMQVILPYFNKVRNGCLVTLEDVEIVLQKSGTAKKKWFD